MEHITTIKEIDSIKDDFTIKVRIIHLWTQKSKFNAKETYSIEMILMDEEGRKIHTSCVKKWFPKFKRYLKEDSSIYVKKPNVAPNTLNFKFVDPERKLNFYHDTTVKECENFSGSAHDFDFVDFNTVVSNNILESNSFDIIGHILEYGRMDTSEEDKSKHKILLHLQDIEDTKRKVTLWGHNAYYMTDFLANNNSLAPIVVIVQFARVKFINGRPFSSTYFDVSRLFINNDIDEITSYKYKLVSENGQQLSSSGIKMIASKRNTEHDDFLKNHMFSNIDELFEPLEVLYIIFKQTILRKRSLLLVLLREYVKTYDGITLLVATAKEKESSTDKVDGSHEVAEIVTYECSNPNCKNIKISVIPRFKIPLQVQDNTRTLTLTLFDQEAKKLFKYTAKESYDKNKKLGISLDLYPMELKFVVDKKLAIKIDITSYNVDNKSNIYGIARLTKNANIIDELEKKNLNSQPANFDSFIIGSSDIASQETKVVKAEFVPILDPSLTEQYEYANEHDIKCLIIISDTGVSQKGSVKIRHLELKREKEVSRESLTKFLSEAMASQSSKYCKANVNTMSKVNCPC
ncbi:unnamed protein product [Lactuca saligna]|uniref:Replication protein A 70 kDa DNA-binding subunit B/D first OB fold domain-containing protein n=1 Tax=Lactuca saligna TaxID=75948 RepID=A0AA35YP85_LACSI|nr:unnamed protein product [Lactuca saligna]